MPSKKTLDKQILETIAYNIDIHLDDGIYYFEIDNKLLSGIQSFCKDNSLEYLGDGISSVAIKIQSKKIIDLAASTYPILNPLDHSVYFFTDHMELGDLLTQHYYVGLYILLKAYPPIFTQENPALLLPKGISIEDLLDFEKRAKHLAFQYL